MSMFDFPEEGSDYYFLKRQISELKDKVNSLPIQIEGTNLGFSPSVLVPQSAGSTVAGGDGGVETDYLDEGDTSGDITITIDGNKKYVRKYTLTGDITSITITSTNLTILFPTDLILIFEQTGTNEYTLPDVSALHPDTVLSQQVIVGGEIEEFEFVTYDAGTEWILKSQHDNALLAYLLNLTSAGWASLTNFAEGARDAILGLGMAIEDGITYLWKQIDDAWENASGDTWEEKLVSLISTQLTSVLTDFGEQIIAWWNGLADDDDNNAVDEFFYQIKTIGAPVFEWMADWENDTRSTASDVTYSDPPTFAELSTGDNAFHFRIIRGVNTWWDGLTVDSNEGFDPFFYQIKTIGEPVFKWMADWETDTRASGTPANPTFSQLTTGENVVYKRVIRGVTTWWDALPAVTAASGFDLPFAYLKEWFSAGSDLGAWLFTNVVTPVQTWWDDTTETGTDADNSFPARAWRGITALGDAFVEDVLEGLGTVWEFFNENIITPVKEWWDDTEDTTTGADNTIPARVWRGIIALTPFGNDIVTEVTDGLDWAFDTVTETWDYIRGNVTDFGANILEGFGSAWAYFNSNIVTPIQTWWETTADTASPADDSIPARVWRGILDLGSAFTDGISDGVSDALDTAIEGLTFVDGTIRDWINDNLNVVAVRAGLLTLGTWLGIGASVIGKVVTDLPGQLYTGATTFTHVVRGVLFGGINTTAAGWLGAQGAAVLVALNGTVDAAWTWLQDLGTQARSFLTGINNAAHSTLDTVIEWVGDAEDALTWIAGTLSAGATSLVDAAIAVLFDDKTQYVFAQDEAGTKITAELGSSGDITAKIGAEITDAWEDFWVDLGETAHGVNTSLTTILSDIADFFTGSSSSSDGATVELDNLGTTSINKPLIFDLSVNAGADDDTVSISQANDDLYLKAPSGDRIYQQIAGTTIAEARSDQFKISKKLLFGNSSVPGNTETGIGVSNNGLYMKNSGSDKIYFQSGGNSLLRISGTQVESRHLVPQGNSLYKLGDSAARWSIGYIDDLKIYDDLAVADTIRVGSSSVPTSTTKLDGDIWKSGDDVMIQSGGSSRNISSAGGGSYTAATMEDFLQGLTSVTSTTGTLSNTFMVDVGTVVQKMSLTTLKSIMSVANRDLSNLSNVDINTALLFDTQSAPASNANGIGRTTLTNTSHPEAGFRFNLSNVGHAFYFDFAAIPSFLVRLRTIGLPHSTSTQTNSDTESPEGHIWYNSTDNKFQGRAGTTIVDLAGGGGSADFSAVNTDIIPATDENLELGSDDKVWDALYTRSIYFGNDSTINDRPLILESGKNLEINVAADNDITLECKNGAYLTVNRLGVTIGGNDPGFDDDLSVAGQIKGIRQSSAYSTYGSNPNNRSIASGSNTDIVRSVLNTLITDLKAVGILGNS